MRRLLAALTLVATLGSAARADEDGGFEDEIRAFEAADRAQPPPKDAVLFIGSSSVRLWKTLAQDFPAHTVINRGFGGSQVADSLRYVDRIVIPYAPRAIVMYAGGNDLAAGKTPEQIARDFRAFARAVHAKLPRTKIAYISIAPNPERWPLAPRTRALNRAVAAFTRTDPRRLAFFDVWPHMLAPGGGPRPELFAEDRLHMNASGYALWTRLLAPQLARLVPPESSR